MVFDHIIIGSGLTGLAVALGLPKGGSVAVVAGLPEHQIKFYDGSSTPCQNLSQGGLGQFWHGVIPVSRPQDVSGFSAQDYFDLFDIFYPGEELKKYYGSDRYFVPYRPIRPKQHWPDVMKRFSVGSQFSTVLAKSLRQIKEGWQVNIDGGYLTGKTLWLAAGTLGTAALLSQMPRFAQFCCSAISDHVIICLGQMERQAFLSELETVPQRSRHGTWFGHASDHHGTGLVTFRPARFDFRKMDQNVVQRDAFGLPASGVVKKILRAGSAGLISEAIFNKFGIFGNASRYNVYLQHRVKDAFSFNPQNMALHTNSESLHQQIGQIRQKQIRPGLVPSGLPQAFSYGIHLHGSINDKASEELQNCHIHIVDASAIENIGHEHHSFRVMAAAFSKARNV